MRELNKENPMKRTEKFSFTLVWILDLSNSAKRICEICIKPFFCNARSYIENEQFDFD